MLNSFLVESSELLTKKKHQRQALLADERAFEKLSALGKDYPLFPET